MSLDTGIGLTACEHAIPELFLFHSKWDSPPALNQTIPRFRQIEGVVMSSTLAMRYWQLLVVIAAVLGTPRCYSSK